MVDDKLAAALKTAMEQHLDARRIREVYSRFEGSGKRLVLFKRAKVIARTEDSIERVLVLLHGTCNVLKHSVDGRTVLAGTVQAPQIFGLFELINNMDTHTADIETVTDCFCFSISPDLYRDQYEKNMEVMRYSSKFLACFIDQLLDRSDRMTLNSDRQNLLLYCLEACRNESFPVVIAVRKETLAASLNMNLRTLYRKIAQLKDEGLIGSQKGKISIDREQYIRLKLEFDDSI
jgi:CRP-like cAMP-binding protein